MALCRRSRVPVSHCGLLVALHMPSLELQMPAERDRVVFVLFVSRFDKLQRISRFKEVLE